MKVLQLISEHAIALIMLFIVGAVLSYLREARKIRSGVWRWLEWIFVPLGYAAIFIVVQGKSVRLFAFHPVATLAACGAIAAICGLLRIVRRKKPDTAAAWLGGFLGVPGILISLFFAGYYLKTPEKFSAVKETLSRFDTMKGKIAPDFSFLLVGREEQKKLSDYRGRVVLLNVWATWCIPCLKEMPDLHRLQKEFKDRGLVVINLSDEPSGTIEQYLSKNPMATTHARIHDVSRVPAFYQFGIVRPTSFLIARTGEVIEAVPEARDFAYFEARVRRNL